MEFAGMNYLAILLAAIAAMPVGAIWYGTLAKPWMAAAGLTEEDAKKLNPVVYLVAAICHLIIAFFLAGVIGHLGTTSLWGGVVTAFFCWLGFVVPTMCVNHRFQFSGWNLTAIDGGHWLATFALQGAIIGWFGI